jgi:MYXO-CTERM domain-containing protein
MAVAPAASVAVGRRLEPGLKHTHAKALSSTASEARSSGEPSPLALLSAGLAFLRRREDAFNI